MNNIYLVGFMGTGKSAVGRELARKSKRRFIDLDEHIELREGRRISDIFALDGEPYFRRLEKRCLKEVAREYDFVVSCGGGIVIDRENIALMKATGKVVCLSASVGVILKRTSQDTCRPLLQTDNPRECIEHLLKLRAPYYAQADIAINTTSLSVTQVVKAILFKIKSKKKR